MERKELELRERIRGMEKELKKVEIINGKFTLEKKIVKINPLKLIVLDIDMYNINQDTFNREDHKWKGGKIVETKLRKLEYEERLSILKEKEDELKILHDNKPEEANGYVTGKGIFETSSGEWGSPFGTPSYNHYPVLYLRMKRK